MLAAVNVGAMEPSTVHSIVDAFFEVKKVEVKQRLQLEMDRVVEDLFGELVGQVKQLLVPGTKSCAQIDKSVTGGSGANVAEPKAQSASTFGKPKCLLTTDPPKPPDLASPERKFFVVKSVPSTSGNTSVKGISPSVADTTSGVSNQAKSFSTKVENEASDEDASEKQLSTKSDKRARTDSGDGHKCNKKVKSSAIEQTQPQQEESQVNTFDSPQPISINQTQEAITKPKFVCQSAGCGKDFNRKDSLQRHQRTHENVKPYLCKWADCSYASNDRSHTITHIQRVHLTAELSKQTQQHEGDPIQMDPKAYLEIDKEALKTN